MGETIISYSDVEVHRKELVVLKHVNWFVEQRTRYGNALLFATRKLMWHFI